MSLTADQITVSGAAPQWRVPAAARALAAALKRGRFVDPACVVVFSVSVVGRPRMRELNRIYRGKKSVTDVLSFEQPTGGPSPRGVRLLGDLVLCGPVVREQARVAGHGLRDEVVVLLAHGLLHLLGHDHERSAAEAAKMARAEAKLLGLASGQIPGLIARSQVKGSA